MSLKLRQWQKEALDKATDWLLVQRRDRHFLINAAPGAGKTLAACAIAQKLIQDDEIDRVVVIGGEEGGGSDLGIVCGIPFGVSSGEPERAVVGRVDAHRTVVTPPIAGVKPTAGD